MQKLVARKIPGGTFPLVLSLCLWGGNSSSGQNPAGKNADKPPDVKKKDDPKQERGRIHVLGELHGIGPLFNKPTSGQNLGALPFEEMLEKALKGNPDIKVAEAKVQEAEAELNRTRLQVTRKVFAFHKAIEAQQEFVRSASADFKETEKLFLTNAVPHKNMENAKQDLIAAKAKLTELESELPYLLGQSTGFRVSLGTKLNSNGQANWVVEPTHTEYFGNISFNERLPANVTAHTFTAPEAAKPGSMADKIRKALDAPITIKIDNGSIADVLALFEKNAPGIAFRSLDTPPPAAFNARGSEAINLRLDSLALGAAIQAVEDSIPGLHFVVRDYGILVGWKDALPMGAVSVESFWKTKIPSKNVSGQNAK